MLPHSLAIFFSFLISLILIKIAPFFIDRWHVLEYTSQKKQGKDNAYRE